LGQIGRKFFTFVIAVVVSGCVGGDQPTRVAQDPVLRAQPVSLYAAADTTRPPRAVIFFFGNDIGFWQPHRQLAAALARSQYAVAGFDMRPLLRKLPDRGQARERPFLAAIEPIVMRSRHELAGDSVPLIIAGHSLGAEVAIWTAAHACLPGTVGVLALSPGSRSHLRVAVSDIMNGPEPTEPGSFSVADAIASVPNDERVAVIRGSRDKFARADSALLAAGGDRIERFSVLLAGHSLKGLTMASFETRRALDWLLERDVADR
jgi:pimeloyl-ACP methyl ester carboxylesterase